MDRKSVYAAKLRDPRWQKRRLEILQRDEFSCQRCQDTATTLHVHHRRYFHDRDPWEYEDCYLVTLCEPCHAEEQETFPQEVATLAEIVASKGYFACDVSQLAIAILTAPGNSHYFLSLIDFLSHNQEAYELLSGQFHEVVNANRSEAITPALTESE